MGVILFHDVGRRTNRRTPHTHGGDSSRRSRREVDDWYSPYTWGWFYSLNDAIRQGYVLPIHMGVILFRWSYPSVLQSTPHTHGGDSAPFELFETTLRYSPYTWGWFQQLDRIRECVEVLPIHMGVILNCIQQSTLRNKYSPYTWGWFLQGVDDIDRAAVLPIHMGVILKTIVLHIKVARYSPYTWGWFRVWSEYVSHASVLPIHMGVILIQTKQWYFDLCTPHTHGGDSRDVKGVLHVYAYSP